MSEQIEEGKLVFDLMLAVNYCRRLLRDKNMSGHYQRCLGIYSKEFGIVSPMFRALVEHKVR